MNNPDATGEPQPNQPDSQKSPAVDPPAESKAMRKPGRNRYVRIAALVILLMVAVVAGYTLYSSLRVWVLRKEFKNAEANGDQDKMLRASATLLPYDRGQLEYLFGRLLTANPQDVEFILESLASHQEELREKLWAVAEDPSHANAPRRLRAACALALYDPESQRWTDVQGMVANDLVGVPAVQLAAWIRILKPAGDKFVGSLGEISRDAQRGEIDRLFAAEIVADFAGDQPVLLAEMLMDADEKQFAAIYPRFKDRAAEGLPLLAAEIDKVPAPGTLPSDQDRDKLAKRQANAATALLKMNQPDKVWALLEHRADPTVRGYLIHRLALLGVPAAAIVDRLNAETDIAIRRALLLSLGELGDKQIPAGDLKALLPKLQEMYRTATDPGVHATVEWLLRTWKQEAWLAQVSQELAKDKQARAERLERIAEALAKEKAKCPPQWYVNSQGQTFVVIPGPVVFWMGSHNAEEYRRSDEVQHKQRIGRTFAIAAKPVTVEQFKQFMPAYSPRLLFSRMPELPAVEIDWYMAASYCNWLSKEEGIGQDQWCYETNGRGEVSKLKEKYLSLTGYRLPTEAEMEYAARAGSATSRHFGVSEELLAKYAWYHKNSQTKTWPAGSLKPNDLGLFDTMGNVFNWCQESYKPYPANKGDEAADDNEDELAVASAVSRVLRGSSCRAATRLGFGQRGLSSNKEVRVSENSIRYDPTAVNRRCWRRTFRRSSYSACAIE
jgi:formylglycine-generating enzyme required for sulfatase activity